MEKIKFDQLQEEILHETMANGLEVYVIPKKVLINRLQPLRPNTDPLIIILSR